MKNRIYIIVICIAIILVGLLFFIKKSAIKENDKIKDVIIEKVIKLPEQKTLEYAYEQEKRYSFPRIVCFGDSLTYGVGGNDITYPNVLSEITNLEVINYGVGGDSAQLVSNRQGSSPVYIKNAVITSSNIKPVEITLVNAHGDKVDFSRCGNGINPCYIDDIEGVLSYDKESDKYFFTRKEIGSELIVKRTRLITHAMKDKKTSDILVLFCGTNNQPNASNIQDIIKIQREMIEYADTDNYIIIGMTSKDYMIEVEEVNKILSQEYGDKFLDIRTYLLEKGLEYSDITPTEQDIEDIQNGEIPSSLRIDTVHGNEYFYKIIGEKVYEKIIELGYLSSQQIKDLKIN